MSLLAIGTQFTVTLYGATVQGEVTRHDVAGVVWGRIEGTKRTRWFHRESINPMPRDTSHLVALCEGLQRERARLASATPSERALRSVWVAQREREIAAEMRFLGMPDDASEPALTDAELLAELLA